MTRYEEGDLVLVPLDRRPLATGVDPVEWVGGEVVRSLDGDPKAQALMVKTARGVAHCEASVVRPWLVPVRDEAAA